MSFWDSHFTREARGGSRPPTGEVAAVLLAAGQARRFGSHKLLASFRGRPLLGHVLEVAGHARTLGVVSDVVTVVAAGDTVLDELAHRAAARTVVNETPDLGLSSSLACGLAALGDRTGAALVLLADQPLVRLEVLAMLIAGWRAGLGALVRPRYTDTPDAPGHPVLADRSLWPLAATLAGDRGFGSVLPPGAPGVALIEVAGRNPDVDTPDDLATLEGST